MGQACSGSPSQGSYEAGSAPGWLCEEKVNSSGAADLGRTQPSPWLQWLGSPGGSKHVCFQMALTSGAAECVLEANREHLKCLGVELRVKW